MKFTDHSLIILCTSFRLILVPDLVWHFYGLIEQRTFRSWLVLLKCEVVLLMLKTSWVTKKYTEIKKTDISWSWNSRRNNALRCLVCISDFVPSPLLESPSRQSDWQSFGIDSLTLNDIYIWKWWLHHGYCHCTQVSLISTHSKSKFANLRNLRQIQVELYGVSTLDCRDCLTWHSTCVSILGRLLLKSRWISARIHSCTSSS